MKLLIIVLLVAILTTVNTINFDGPLNFKNIGSKTFNV